MKRKNTITIKVQENQMRELRGLLIHIDRELKTLKGERKLPLRSDLTYWQWTRWGLEHVLVPIIVAGIAYLAIRDGAILGKVVSNFIGMP